MLKTGQARARRSRTRDGLFGGGLNAAGVRSMITSRDAAETLWLTLGSIRAQPSPTARFQTDGLL